MKWKLESFSTFNCTAEQNFILFIFHFYPYNRIFCPFLLNSAHNGATKRCENSLCLAFWFIYYLSNGNVKCSSVVFHHHHNSSKVANRTHKFFPTKKKKKTFVPVGGEWWRNDAHKFKFKKLIFFQGFHNLTNWRYKNRKCVSKSYFTTSQRT